MEKKETNTLSIFQRPVWVSLFALTAAISWGWAYPLIKMGMEEYQITADMTGSKMLFAGIRFFISDIIIVGRLKDGDQLRHATRIAMDTLRNWIDINKDDKDKNRGIPIERHLGDL